MRIAIALGGAVLLALSGCGGDGAESGGTGGGGETIEIALSDFALDPATVRVDAAGTYTFRAVNDGETGHALEVEGGGVEEETDELGPGESGELTVELEPGTYELYCPIGGHRAAGMEGELVVGAAGASGGGATTGGDDDYAR